MVRARRVAIHREIGSSRPCASQGDAVNSGSAPDYTEKRHSPQIGSTLLQTEWPCQRQLGPTKKLSVDNDDRPRLVIDDCWGNSRTRLMKFGVIQLDRCCLAR